MSRRERAAFKRRLAPGKKRVVKIAARRHIARTLSAGDRLHCQVHNGGVGVSLAGQHRGAYLIAVLPRIACDHERRWNRDYLCGGDRAIKSIVQAVQVPCVVLEIWHHMRIGDYQPGGYTGDAEGWQPMMSLG